MGETCSMELLRLYYKRLFPIDTFYDWLCYSHEDKKDNSLLHFREFSFTLPGDIYSRYNTFNTKDELMDKIATAVPVKIDIGAEYNEPPNRFKSRNIQPVRRELVFDIDLTDYDDLRKCCKQGDICLKCWKYMIIACKIIDSTIKEDFGFEHILWVYSGRRGIHGWICDKNARSLPGHVRVAIVDYLNLVVPKNHNSYKKKIRHFRQPFLHPAIQRALSIIDKYFIELCVEDQGMLDTNEDIKKFLGHIPDEKLKEQLRVEFDKYTTSKDRWEAFLSTYNNYKKNGRPNFYLSHLVEEIKAIYAYPRLDVDVSKGMKHLLKAPFCVHPKTGKVCIPFNASAIEKFNPLKVPTIKVLTDEINSYDSLLDPQVPNFSRSEVKDYRKTSLLKSILVFEQFVAKLFRSKDQDDEMEF